MPIIPGFIGRSKTASSSSAGGFWTLTEQLVNRAAGTWTRNNPTYSISSNVASANEGQSILFSVVTTEEDNGNVLYWTNAGTTIAADFLQNVNSGSLTITSGNNIVGTTSFILTLQTDLTSEGPETVQIQLRKGSTSGTVVATGSLITIADTSITPTYAIIPSANSINEGSSVTFTVNTYQIPDGTSLYYTLSGVQAADITGGALSGSFTITANTGSVTVTTTSDLSTEGPETMTFQLRTISTSGTIVLTSNVVINDTSLSPLQADFFIVGGGGPGGFANSGNHNAGGGGAGGMVEVFNANLLLGTSYTVTIGGGGSPPPGGYDVAGSPGTNSSIVGTNFTYIAMGGGYGGGRDGTGAGCASGGSGGGGSSYQCGGLQFSTYGYGYGNAGGWREYNGFGQFGGGGGAGGVGGKAQADGGTGVGGVGRASPFPGIYVGELVSGTYYLAGGGGGTGGIGGSGGGGSATYSTNGCTAGIANTGGGGGAGGAGGSPQQGKTGGSGVCVVRYSGLQKATGGEVTQAGGYTYHIFKSTSTFTITQPTYAVAVSNNSINEGSSVTFTVSTYQISDGTTLYYTLSGVQSADISGGTLSGSVVINSSFANVSVTTTNDIATEGPETMTFELRTVSTSGTIVATANVIISDTSLGTFNADYLVVAGGGGAGSNWGGGGGAGGYRSGTMTGIVPGTAYQVTVGAGGGAGSNGSNSIFNNITSTGGGYSGSNTGPSSATSGGSGGSGGGGGGGGPGPAGGTGTPGQGNNGAQGVGGAGGGAGGGGGASAAGSVGSANTGGVGGNGSTWVDGVTRAGGGGGGGRYSPSRSAGGSGGGGSGGYTITAPNNIGNNGDVNTGGGAGGGGSDGGAGGSGGSGIVLIKYPDTYSATLSAGLTSSTATAGGYKTVSITVGTGTITFG